MSARYAKAVFEQLYDIDLFGPGAAKGFQSERPNSPSCTHFARCISPRQEDDNTLLNYLNDAFEASCPSKACKWVLIVLANHANEKGECWPSVARICRHTGLTDRGVQLALKELVDKGFIEIIPKIGRTNHYIIKMTPEASSPPPPKQLHPSPEASSPKPSYNPHLKQPPISPLPMNTQPVLFKDDSLKVDFAIEIYKAYPRHITKPGWHRVQAIKEIRKALKEVKPEWLLKKTQEYAEARKDQDEQYTPYAAKWFREKRFNDEPSNWLDKFKKPDESEDYWDRELRIETFKTDALLAEAEKLAVKLRQKNYE